MRIAVVFIFVLFACTYKKVVKEKPGSDALPAVAAQATAFDSTVYIGPISYFADTKEFYTPLYYSEEVKIDESYEYLTKAVDSLLYSQNGVSRKRLPYETAQWFFKIGGMASVSLFSMENNKVGEARLVRIELYNDAGGDQFIAVYKATGSDDLSKKAVYCASAFEDDLKTIRIRYEQGRNERLARLVFDKFGVNEGTGVKHAKLQIHNSVYSTLDLGTECLLLEIKDDQVAVVHQSKEDYCISRLLPTHFEINGKPVLITSMSVRDSNVMWTSLAVFSGRRYEFADRCRVKIR